MVADIGVAGFLVVFGLVWGLLRYEFEMPRLVALAFGGMLILLGVVAAALGQVMGTGSVSGYAGVAVGSLVTLSALLPVVN